MSARPLLFAFRRCLLRALGPTALATGVAIAGALLHGDLAAALGGALSPWLQLAPFVAAVACSLAAIDYWPTFAKGRPGTDFVLRNTARPLHGCGVAAAGALLALLAMLLPMAALAALVLPAPRVHRPLAAIGRALLDSGDREVSFAIGGIACDEIRLRPVAMLPKAAPVPTELQLLADGAPLLPEPIAIGATRQLVRVPTNGHAMSTLTVRRAAGNLPLLFAADSVVVVESAARSRLLGSALAFCLYLVPAAVALALAMLLAPLVAMPVNFLVAAAAVALQVFAELGPSAMGLSLLARGHWLPAEPIFRACIPSLGTGLAAMIGAMVARAGARR